MKKTLSSKKSANKNKPKTSKAPTKKAKVSAKIKKGLSEIKADFKGQIKKARTSSKKLSSKIKNNLSKNIKVDQFLTEIPNKILNQIDQLRQELPNQKESVQTLTAIGLRILDEAKKVSENIKPNFKKDLAKVGATAQSATKKAKKRK